MEQALTPKERVKAMLFYNHLAERIIEKMYLDDIDEEQQIWLEDQLGNCENEICMHRYHLIMPVHDYSSCTEAPD